jgi:hypothetical protein
VKLLKGKRLRPDLGAADHPAFSPVHSAACQASIGSGGQTKAGRTWLPPGSVIAPGAMWPVGTEDRASG